MTDSKLVYVPVSIGELFDKITILEVKLEKLPQYSSTLKTELQLLLDTLLNLDMPEDFSNQRDELKRINRELWDIEEGKREHERSQDFGERFIFLARQVYLMNDQRASLKRAINMSSGSQIIEVKSHFDN